MNTIHPLGTCLDTMSIIGIFHPGPTQRLLQWHFVPFHMQIKSSITGNCARAQQPNHMELKFRNTLQFDQGCYGQTFKWATTSVGCNFFIKCCTIPREEALTANSRVSWAVQMNYEWICTIKYMMNKVKKRAQSSGWNVLFFRSSLFL